MQRTDLSSRQCLLIVVLISLMVLLLLKVLTNTATLQDILVHEDEILLYRENGFNVSEFGQMITKKSDIWIKFQEGVSGYKSSLENYQRLNLNLQLTTYQQLAEKVQECKGYKMNSELADLQQEINEEKLKLDNTNNQTKWEALKIQQSELKQQFINSTQKLQIFQKQLEHILIPNINIAVTRTKTMASQIEKNIQEKQREQMDVSDLKFKLQALNISINDQEKTLQDDLSQYYIQDQQAARQFQEIFKDGAADFGDVNEVEDPCMKQMLELIKTSKDTANQQGSEFKDGLQFNSEQRSTEYNRLIINRKELMMNIERKTSRISQLEDEILNQQQESANVGQQLNNLYASKEDNRRQSDAAQKEIYEIKVNLEFVSKQISNYVKPVDAYDQMNQLFETKIKEFINKYKAIDLECYQQCAKFVTQTQLLGMLNSEEKKQAILQKKEELIAIIQQLQGEL